MNQISPWVLCIILLLGLVLFALYMSYRIGKLANQIEQTKEDKIDETLKNESLSDLVRDANDTNSNSGGT